jgi:glycosyltransferase involved in cell wall biosynthesis
MRIVQLMASPFFGGPERQMVGMSRHLPADCETLFLSFAEGGKARSLLDEVRRAGLHGDLLTKNFPHVGRSVREIADRLREWRADVVCTSGYKPDILGWRAARQVGIPVIVVSHGWTAATWKVRLYERLDRWVHARADAVVCVSEAQAAKVRSAGVDVNRIVTIVNAVADDAFAPPDPAYGKKLREYFPKSPRWIVGAAGRLSPEKGFDQLVAAAGQLCQSHPDIGVIIFGEGPMRAALESQIASLALEEKVVLAGFRGDVGRYLPHLDVGALPSFTEGLPVILLEMLAAGRSVVATAVGGIPEVIAENATGWLVPAGDAASLATRLGRCLDEATERNRVGDAGRAIVRERFGVARQCEAYRSLFSRLTASTSQPVYVSRAERPGGGASLLQGHSGRET